MSPPSPKRTDITMSFPRVSGDEPTVVNSVSRLNQFSPRERG